MDTKDKRRTGRPGQKRPAAQTSRRASAPAGERAGQRKAPTRAARPDHRSAPSRSGAPEKRRRSTATQRPARSQRSARPAAPREPLPEVVYTPPKAFSKNGLLLKLATVAAVVLALTFGISIFFKVDTITVSGAKSYSEWTVREASGIQQGDNLLSFGEARACGKIKRALPYVKNVRIGIKLPDTVNIVIEELDVVYSIRDESDNWWLITSDGQVVDQVDAAKAGEYTEILGLRLSLPAKSQPAVAAEPAPQETAEGGQTVPVTVKGSERLQAVLTILDYMEQNEIIGEVASVDVSDMGQIELWYGKQFQVLLGDTTELSKKIRWLKEAVDSLDDYQSGILDISLTHWENEVGYTPFT